MALYRPTKTSFSKGTSYSIPRAKVSVAKMPKVKLSVPKMSKAAVGGKAAARKVKI